MVNVGVSNGYLEYVKALWYILWSFGKDERIWYIFTVFGVLCNEKSGSPESNSE
jgi:hypothetical protein